MLLYGAEVFLMDALCIQLLFAFWNLQVDLNRKQRENDFERVGVD